MTDLAPGDPAPDFSLETDASGKFVLSSHRGKRVVLYFYPQDDTPTCTSENIEFSRASAKFRAAGVVVVGISPDSVDRHRKFRRKHALTTMLAADPSHQAIAAYGVWGPKVTFGKHYDGLLRTTFLIDAGGRIVNIWRVARLKGHVDEVLAAVQGG